MFVIEPANFAELGLRDLIRLHLAGMYAASPPDQVSALDLTGLEQPDVTMIVARSERGGIAGMAALKQLDAASGEIKSMRTHPDHLRRGVAGRLLDHLIATARSRNMVRLSLETGSGPPFEPALALYRRRGFQDGGPFGNYVQSDFNQFLHLGLTAGP